MSIKRLCCATGCPNFREENSSYCKKHSYLQEAREERSRKYFENRPRVEGSFHNTPRWKKLRAELLEKQPYCSICGGTDKLQVHHTWNTKEYLENADMFFDTDHLQVLCHRCHTRISNRKANRRTTSLNYSGDL